MTEKRFRCVFKEHETKNSWSMIKDNQLDKPLYIKDVVDLLNELSDENNILNKNEDDLEECTIENIKLKEENEQLRQMIKENVFQRYREGSLADLKFKAIAYEDIIKVKLSDESEPKVIVYCNYGKRENIKSFCQMFIPFGIVYDIKEVIDDE